MKLTFADFGIPSESTTPSEFTPRVTYDPPNVNDLYTGQENVLSYIALPPLSRESGL